MIINLATPTCQPSGRGGRPPNERERAIFELWKNRGLEDKTYSSGSLIAFFKQLDRAL